MRNVKRRLLFIIVTALLGSLPAILLGVRPLAAAAPQTVESAGNGAAQDPAPDSAPFGREPGVTITAAPASQTVEGAGNGVSQGATPFGREPAAPSVIPPPAAPITVPAQSILVIAMPHTLARGMPVEISALLMNRAGRPQPNKVLILYLDGEQVHRIRTDQNGRATMYAGRDVALGDHQVEVTFIGTEAYRSTTATGAITIRPARLTINTVPPLPGVGFSLNGVPFYAGADGAAHLDVTTPGVYPLTLLPLPEPTKELPEKVEFERWADGVYDPNRQVDMYGDQTFDIGFDLSYPVGQTFVDLTGRPVNDARISSLTLKSSHGTRYTYKNGEPRWRQANRVARLKNGLEATEIQYGIESVMVDGANVVNMNQQRFLVKGEDTWSIELLLYSARIRARDAIFGFPIGTGVNLTYPDGHTKFIPFGDDKEIFIELLARGLYKVQVQGVSGMAPITPLALSKDQDVALKVLSSFDIGLGIVLGLFTALGMLFYGRPQLLTLPVRLLRQLGRARRPEPRPQSEAPAYPGAHVSVHRHRRTRLMSLFHRTSITGGD